MQSVMLSLINLVRAWVARREEVKEEWKEEERTRLVKRTRLEVGGLLSVDDQVKLDITWWNKRRVPHDVYTFATTDTMENGVQRVFAECWDCDNEVRIWENNKILYVHRMQCACGWSERENPT